MPTPQEFMDQMFAEAKAKVEAENAEKLKAASAGQDQVATTIKQIGEVLPKIVDNQKLLDARIAAMEQAKQRSTDNANDPYKRLTDDLGITSDHLAPVVQHEVDSRVEKAVERVFEKSLGPALRQTAAVNEYQERNPDFDMNRLNSYLAKNPEVKQYVAQAAAQGAYGLGVEYAETRRQMDEKISTEARVQARGDKRRQLIEETRPDAAILGGTGANGSSRVNVKQPISADQLANIFAHAEANNWQPFEDAFVNPNLPTEEEFQRLAQS